MPAEVRRGHCPGGYAGPRAGERTGCTPQWWSGETARVLEERAAHRERETRGFLGGRLWGDPLPGRPRDPPAEKIYCCSGSLGEANADGSLERDLRQRNKFITFVGFHFSSQSM